MKEYEYKITAAGRINIVGEHIDYCGGKVMPAAISLKNTVYIRPNGTNQINLKWTTLPDEVTLDIDKLESYKGLKYGNYQAGAALMWQRGGLYRAVWFWTVKLGGDRGKHDSRAFYHSGRRT